MYFFLKKTSFKVEDCLFADLVNNPHVAVGIYTYVAGRYFIQDYNDIGLKIEGCAYDDVIGKDLETVFPALREYGLIAVLDRVRQTGITEHYEALQPYQDQFRVGWRDNYVVRLNDDMVASFYRSNYSDYHDRLGIRNKRYLQDSLKQIDQNFGMLFIKLAGMPDLNYMYGFEHGDKIIKAIAHELSLQILPPHALVVKEDYESKFIAVIPNIAVNSELRLVASIVKDALDKLSILKTPGHSLQVFIGGCLASPVQYQNDYALLFQHTQDALSAAHEEVDQICVFSQEVLDNKQRLQDIRDTLIEIVENDNNALEDKLYVVWQPKVVGGRIKGFEQLMRLSTAKYGEVAPAEFIDIAEHCLHENKPLVAYIDRIGLREGLRRFNDWWSSGMRFSLAFNLSRGTLDDLTLIPWLARCLSGMSLTLDQRAALEMEITETGRLSPERSATIIALKRQLGLSIAIDDFAKEQSNTSEFLNMLTARAVDVVKIDKQDIDRVLRCDHRGDPIINPKTEKVFLDSQGCQFIQNIFRLIGAPFTGKKKIVLVAEGVQYAEQEQFLMRMARKYSIDLLIQGFLHGRPQLPEFYFDRLRDQGPIV